MGCQSHLNNQVSQFHEIVHMNLGLGKVVTQRFDLFANIFTATGGRLLLMWIEQNRVLWSGFKILDKEISSIHFMLLDFSAA